MPFKRSFSAKLLHPVFFLFLTLTVFFVYKDALHHTFVWDSIYYLSGNPYITELTAENLKWMLTTNHLSNWHPVTWLSYTFDYYFYDGLQAYGFHLTNLIIHILNSLLFYYVALIILRLAYSQTNDLPLQPGNIKLISSAFIGAILFSIHPQHVESVAWVAERKDLLFLLFLQLSFLAYIRYTVSAGSYRYYYLLSLTLYSLALMSKPMAVTFPALLLIADIYPLRRLEVKHRSNTINPKLLYKKILLEKLPFLLLSLATVFATLHAQKGAIESTASLSIEFRIYNAFESIFLYLSKTIIPLNLSPYYPHPYHNNSDPGLITLLSILGFIFITVLGIYLWKKKHPAPLAAWLFYLVTLSPVIGIIQVGSQAAADRYTYLTTLPFYFFIAAGAYTIFNTKNPILITASLILTLSACFLLSHLTKAQVSIWQSNSTLWEHAAKLYPDNGHIHGNLAAAYYDAGYYTSAKEHYENAIKHGYFSVAHLPAAAMTYIRLQKYNNALTLYLSAIASYGHNPAIEPLINCFYLNIGLLHLQQEDYSAANEALMKIAPRSQQHVKAQQIIKQLNISAPYSTNVKLTIDQPMFCQQLRKIAYN